MTVTLLILFAAGSQAFEETFTRANDRYFEGDYPQAAREYRQLIREGVHEAPVFYNLANALHQLGDLSGAVVNYERALVVDPGHEQSRYNLQRVLAGAERRLARPEPPAWRSAFMSGGLAPGRLAMVAGALWIAGWALLGVRLVRPVPLGRTAAGLCLVVGVWAAASAWVAAHPPSLAVVNEDGVQARYSAREDATVNFRLYEGDRLRVVSEAGAWFQVSTGGGETGWVPAAMVSRVWPPEAGPADEETDP